MAYLRLSGGCQGCAMSRMTLTQGIEVAAARRGARGGAGGRRHRPRRRRQPLLLTRPARGPRRAARLVHPRDRPARARPGGHTVGHERRPGHGCALAGAGGAAWTWSPPGSAGAPLDPAAPAPLPQDPAGSPAPHPESGHPDRPARPSQPEPCSLKSCSPRRWRRLPAEHPAAEPAPPAAGPPGPAEVAAAAVVTAVLFAAAAVRFGPVPELAAYCVLFAGLVAMSVADIRVGLVPERSCCTRPWPHGGGPGGRGRRLRATGTALGRAADRRGLAFAVFFVLSGSSPAAGMGFGDVRLAGVIGAGPRLAGLPPGLPGVPGRLRGRGRDRAGVDAGPGHRSQDEVPVRARPWPPGPVVGVLWGALAGQPTGCCTPE